MKDKTIESRFPRLMEFGTHPNGDVDVTDVAQSIEVRLAPEHAKQLVAHNDRLLDALISMARAFNEADPGAFDRHWYGKSNSEAA